MLIRVRPSAIRICLCVGVWAFFQEEFLFNTLQVANILITFSIVTCVAFKVLKIIKKNLEKIMAKRWRPLS